MSRSEMKMGDHTTRSGILGMAEGQVALGDEGKLLIYSFEGGGSGINSMGCGAGKSIYTMAEDTD